MKTRLFRNTALSILLTIIMGVLFLFADPQLSSAGDQNISEFLSSPDKIRSGYFYISASLSFILRALNKIAVTNWWSVYSFAMILIATYTVLWFTGKKFQKCNLIIRLSAYIIVCLLLWESVIKNEVCFTQTSVFAGITSILLLTDLVWDRDIALKINARNVIRIILIVLLFLLSAGTRTEMSYIVAAFSMLILVYRLIIPFECDSFIESIKLSFKNRRKVLIGILIALGSLIMSVMISKAEYALDPGIKEWNSSNGYRSDISDYPQRYLSYDENPDLYDSVEIKPSWITMVMEFVSSDTTYFNTQTLRKMVDTRQPSVISLQKFKDSFTGHGMLAVVLGGIVLGTALLRGFKKILLPMILNITVFVCLSAFFMVIGRFEWRVTSSCILLCAVSYIAMSFDDDSVIPKADLYSLSCILLASALILVVEGLCIADEKGLPKFPTAGITDQQQAELLEYINSDKDTVYLYTDMARFVTAYSMWASHSPDYLDNYFPLTSLFIQGCADKLGEYGINDLYSDMLVRPDVKVVYDRTITYTIYPYLTEYYDPCIGISCVDQCGNYMFIRYSSPRIASGKNAATIEAVASEHPGPEEDYAVRTAYDVVCILPDGVEAAYTDYVVNMTDTYTGSTYSYGMSHDGNTVYGTIWCMNDSWSPSVTVATLNGIDSEGNVTELGDITSGFAGILGAPATEEE